MITFSWIEILLSLFSCLSVFLTPTVGSLNYHMGFYSNPYFPIAAASTLGFLLWLLLLVSRFALQAKKREMIDFVFVSLWMVIFSFFFFKHSPLGRYHPRITEGVTLFLAFVLASYLIRWLNRKDLVRFIGLLSLAFLSADFIQFRKLTVMEPRPAVSATPSAAPSPSIVHIVLDKFSYDNAALNHPQFEKKSLELAKKHQLTFHTQHYSNYHATAFSVPDFLKDQRDLDASTGFRELNSNTLFHYFFKKGYDLYLYGHYLPYCLRFKALAKHCQINSREEAKAVFEFSKWAELYLTEFSSSINRIFNSENSYQFLQRYPENALQMFDDYRQDFKKWAQSSHPFYAYLHVVVPHDPFRLSQDCELLPPIKKGMEIEEVRGRLQSQSLCVLKQLDIVLTSIKSQYPGPLKILIHSDHGMFMRDNKSEKKENTKDAE